MDHMLRLVFGLLEWVLIVALSVMVGLVFGNVVLRYLFDTGLPFAEELSRYLFVWITFLGAVVATRERLHIGLRGLIERLPMPAQRACAVLSGGLVIVCCAVLAHGSIGQTHMNWNTSAQVSGIPMFLVYTIPAIAATGIAWLVAVDVWRVMAGATPDDDPSKVSPADG